MEVFDSPLIRFFVVVSISHAKNEGVILRSEFFASCLIGPKGSRFRQLVYLEWTSGKCSNPKARSKGQS